MAESFPFDIFEFFMYDIEDKRIGISFYKCKAFEVVSAGQK